MNVLKAIIERLNQKLDASNLFPSLYGIAAPDPNNAKSFLAYDGNGQNLLTADYDKTDGTCFWTLRSAVSVRKADAVQVVACQDMYVTTFPLRAYTVVKKTALPCDSNATEGYVMDMFWKYVQGKDTALRSSIGVTDIYFRPVSVSPNTPDLPKQFEYVTLYFDLDVEVTAQLIEGCYDECGVNPIPLPDGSCPPINRVVSVTGLDTDNTDPSRPIVKISVDGTTITGEGTPEDPLVAIGGGGGGVNLRVQDEGNTVTNAATSLNFTGNVTASLASTGNVTVNVPSPTPQVNADWNASSGVAQILNKPTIPTETSDLTNDSGFITLSDVPPQVNSDWNASSGAAQILNKPTIPAAQIQSDWNQSNNAAVDFIKNKPTIPSTSGLVPYTGANQDVDLGANGLDAKFIKVTGVNGNGHLNLRHQASNPTATGQSTAIFADNNGNLKIKNDGLSYATFDTNGISADRSYEFPDKSGTVAMTSDVQTYSAGSGLSLTGNTFANTAPDQTVVLTAGTGIGVSGTYPNFTISNTNSVNLARFRSTTNQTAVTGNTNNNRVISFLVPANTIPVGAIGTVKPRLSKTGTAGITTFRLYANTADSITSPAPTLLMTIATGAGTQPYLGGFRDIAIKSATVTQTAQANTSIPSDAVVGNASLTNSNIDWTVDQYLIVAIQNQVSGDSTVLSFIDIEFTW